MPDLPSAYPLRELFDAAVRHYNVRLICRRCEHDRVFDGHALWWLFHRRGWSDGFTDVRRRCVCASCLARGRTVREPKLELVKREPTGEPLPMPTEQDWKREVRRRR